MKNLCWWVAVMGFLFSAGVGLRADDRFEGRVEMKLKSRAENTEMTMKYSVKGERMRMEFQSAEGRGGMIIDHGKKEMVMLMEEDGQKMFMRQPLMDDEAREDEGDAAVPVATGREETILGYRALEYTLTNADKTTSLVWLAKGLGHFMLSGSEGADMGPKTPQRAAWEKVAREGGLFPMRVVNLDKKGEETDRMEVTKIEKVEVPESAFSTAGYTEMKIPGMDGMGFPGMGR